MAKEKLNIGKNAVSSRESKKQSKKVVWEFPFTKQNFILLALGLGVIILGYLLMATGITEEPAVPDGKWNNPLAVVFSPIVLIIGYCVLIPFAILKYFGKRNSDEGLS